MFYQNILETIGNTPLVKINLDNKNRAEIYAKIEAFNSSGSIKDRMATFMLKRAQQKGLLRVGATIIEATTGNTGIAFAMLSTIYKYKMIAVMPENMSEERKMMMRAYGANIILTPEKDGPMGAIRKRDQLAKRIKNSWIPDQFGNQDNSEAHFVTGEEIVKDLGNKIDAFVAGAGTGGTLMGIAEVLKKVNKKILIVAVEPEESAVLSGGKAGNHNIQGIGEGFIPKIIDKDLIDKVEKVSTKEAIFMTTRLAREEGILAGISSGANLAAALKIAKKNGKGKIVVTVFPDRGERYLSEGVFK